MRRWSPTTAAAASPLGLFLLVTAAVTVGGVIVLRGSEIGVAPETVVPGIQQVLGETVPAALLALASSALNVAAGSVAARLFVGRPFSSPGVALLAGLAGAVLVDTAAMLALGSVGAFSQPALLILDAGLLMAGLLAARAGRFMLFVQRDPDPRAEIGAADGGAGKGWDRLSMAALGLLVLIVWGAPIVLQLGSPVVPYGDVIANHVAPVEHLAAFGSFETLVTSPSPIYGPSRIFLGYVATLGALATTTGLHAALAVAAFILPLAIVVAAGAWRAAAGLFGSAAAPWALLTFPLTFTFAQLPDARATVLVFPLLALALDRLVVGSRATTSERASDVADPVLPGITLAAAILVHPALGAFGWLTAVLVVASAPARGGWALSALVAAPVMALAQAATTLGLDVPSWTGLVPLALGLVLLAGWRPRLARPARSGPRWWTPPTAWAVAALVATLAVGSALVAPDILSKLTASAGDLVQRYPLLTIGTIAAALLARGAPGWPVVIAALAIYLVANVVIDLLPASSLLVQSLRFEVPKAVRYWAPWFLAIASAGALAAIWARSGRQPMLCWVAIAAALTVAALPVGREPVASISVEERRFAESVSIQLRRAATGYYVGYPDPRELIDAGRREIVDALRSEQREGRLTAGMAVLHAASSFQQWSGTPIGVFTGALETMVSLDPEASIHTAGGRLFGIDALPELLRQGFGYVVLEPAGLPAEVRDAVIAAGFRPIFANERGEIFARD